MTTTKANVANTLRERPAQSKGTSDAEITGVAISARCSVHDALNQLANLGPHPERTRVGRLLLEAHAELGEWVEAGGYPESEAA